MICTSDRERRHAPNTCAPYFLPSFSPSRFRRRVPRSGAPLHLRFRHSRQRGGPPVSRHERGVLIDHPLNRPVDQSDRKRPICGTTIKAPPLFCNTHNTYMNMNGMSAPTISYLPKSDQPKCDRGCDLYRFKVYQATMNE